MDLAKIQIKNKNYGHFKGAFIYITQDIKDKLEKIPNKQGGNQLQSLLNFGPTGGKYLIEYIQKQFGSKIKIVLSNELCRVDEDAVIINYEQFRKHLNSRFFPIRRKNGLEGTIEYLQKYFPDSFQSIVDLVPTQKEADKVIQSLPSMAQTKERRTTVLEKTAKIIKESGADPKKITPDSLKEIQAAANQDFYRQKLLEFDSRLLKKYPETKGSNSWQSWIYENTWMFGINYTSPIGKQRVGFNSIPDYIFPSIDGFIDILEIKLPSAVVISKYTSHPGSYYWSMETSEAIGQAVNYLSEIEKNAFQIQQIVERTYQIKISTIKPRAIILIGKSDKWNEEQLEAFRKLNHAMHGVEVITFTQLGYRAKSLISLYEKEK